MPSEELTLPTAAIKPYHKQYQGYGAPKRLLNKVSAGTDPNGNDREWKDAYRTYLHTYYDLFLAQFTILNSLQEMASHNFDPKGFVEFRPRICGACGKPLG